MEKFTVLTGTVAPLDRANVDTDQIIPKEYLSSIKRTGFGQGLFSAWRKDPGFVLNQPLYKGASILLARKNFGCGSSREHAPWALEDFGIRCVIAPSFADIFYNNAFKNGMLLIKLAQKDVEDLMHDAELGANAKITVDLQKQEITRPDGTVLKFDIDTFKKHCLLNGLDDIGLTLQKEKRIESFEGRNRAEQPWLYGATRI